MPQSACAFRITSSTLVPCPLPLLSYPISLLLKGRLRMSGATLKVKTVLSYMLSPRTRVISASAPPSPTVSNAVTKNLTMLKGIAPCGSTVVGASTLTTPMTTVLSPIINALRILASFWNGIRWLVTTAQSLLKTTCMSCNALQSTMKTKSSMTSCVVATGIGGAWCYDLVLPPFCFLFSYLFSHMTLCHMVHHLTCHLTFTTWPPYCSDHLIVHKPIVHLVRGCLLFHPFIVLPSPLFCPYCLSLYCPLRPIVRPFRTLSQVAASVVYKPCLYHRRGLKPDLVYQSKCCCFHQLSCVPSSSSISYLFGSSQDPLRLSLQTPSSPQDVHLGNPLQGTTIITKGVETYYCLL